MKSKDEIESGLAGFSGTEAYHQHSILFPLFRLTDGAKWLADECGCYWLFDKIASLQPRLLAHDAWFGEMQFWTLTVKGRKATLKCERDTGDPKPYRERIAWTDFPLDEVRVWVKPEFSEEGKVARIIAYLPSEH